MRKCMLAAVAAVGMGGASEAAVVTYELDYAYDLRKLEFDGYREDDDGTEHHITITTPTRAEYHGSSGALVWEPDSVTDSTSFCCVPEITNDFGEPGYNPYPDLFPYYYVNQIFFDSAPQAWTKTTGVAPVPLPAAATMLLTGAGILLGLRARRRA